MEKLLFIVLLAVEIGLVVFTFLKQRSKKEWTRNRLIANAAELVLFILMAVLPGIDFSFRFACLIFVLIVRLIIAGIRFLIKYKKAEGDVKKAGLIIGSVLVSLVMLLSLIPAFLITDYDGREMTGSYEVAMRHAILVDKSREETFENDGSKREVPIYIYYPENAADNDKFPLVFFSHGSFGYYQSNTSTFMELASNGFVVISIEHPYHSIFTEDTAGKLIIADQKFLNDATTVGNSNGEEDIPNIYDITSAWMAIRMADMNFAIDTVKAACESNSLPSDVWFMRSAEKSPVPTESEMLDILSHANCDKIGLMGHSLGGATSVTVGRTRNDISAVVDLDGTMIGERLGVTGGRYELNEEPYPIPLLSLDNESHYNSGKEEGSYYVNNVVVENGLCAQHSYIKNAEHMNFTDLPLFSPALGAMFGTGSIDAGHSIDLVNEITLSFMDSNLKGDGSYTVNEYYE